jgi:hypothetical protein
LCSLRPAATALPSTPCDNAQADNHGCCLIVTTGGTGPAPRDVTPEATEAVCDRMMPGYGEQMRAISLKYVPTAVLSRQTAGEALVACGVWRATCCCCVRLAALCALAAHVPDTTRW